MKLNSFFLTEQQKEKLVQQAQGLGLTNSEMLRRILDEKLNNVNNYVFQDISNIGLSGNYILSGNTIVTFP
jgi:hypothetical protein